MRPIIYCFPSCGMCAGVSARLIKNVTDLVQVLLKALLLALWLLLMYTHFIIYQWGNNRC